MLFGDPNSENMAALDASYDGSVRESAGDLATTLAASPHVPAP